MSSERWETTRIGKLKQLLVTLRKIMKDPDSSISQKLEASKMYGQAAGFLEARKSKTEQGTGGAGATGGDGLGQLLARVEEVKPS